MPGVKSTHRLANYVISTSLSFWTIRLNRLELVFLELCEGKVLVVSISLQVFPNVCLGVDHSTTPRDRGKELSVDELPGSRSADIRFPLMRMVADSEVETSYLKLVIPFVIQIKRLG